MADDPAVNPQDLPAFQAKKADVPTPNAPQVQEHDIGVSAPAEPASLGEQQQDSSWLKRRDFSTADRKQNKPEAEAASGGDEEVKTSADIRSKKSLFKPVPGDDRVALEQKAKAMVKDLDSAGVGKNISPPNYGKRRSMQTIVGLLGVLVVGLGMVVGMKLLSTEQAGDIRQQAYGKRCQDRTQSECGALGCMDGTYTCKWIDGACKKVSDPQTCGGGGGGGGGTCENVPGVGNVCWCSNPTSCGDNTCMTNDFLAKPCTESSTGAKCWVKSKTCDTPGTCYNGQCENPPQPGDCDALSLGKTLNGVTCQEPQPNPMTFDCNGDPPMISDGRKVSFADCSSKCGYIWQAISFCYGNCPWPSDGSVCCPTTQDACNPSTDNYQCIDDPFVSECVQWGDGTCGGGGGYWKHIVSCSDLCDESCASYSGPGCCGPTKPPSPSDSPRPDFCESLTVVSGGNVLRPGGSVQLRLTATQVVEGFQLSFYNSENLHGPGNPKEWMWPSATVQFVIKQALSGPQSSHIFTLTYDDVNKPDLHPDWNGSNPTSFQVNGYVFGEGYISAADPNCVQRFSIGDAPTPSSRPTPSPAPTMDPFPLVCESLSHTPAFPVLGDEVTFVCSSSGYYLNHYEFQYSVNGGAFVELGETSPASGVSVPLKVNAAGDYMARCRACRSANGTDCTPYETQALQIYSR